MKKKLIIAILSAVLVTGSVTGVVIATKHSHEYISVVTAPTCTEQGYTTHTCECGESYVDSYVDALDHDLETHEAKAPTCVEVGWNEYVTCKREGCNHTTYQEIPATGEHIWNEGEITTEPTCTEKGVRTFTCTVCHQATYTEDIDELGHEYTSVVTAPTCTEQGYTTHTCECGHSYVDSYVDALDHDLETHEAKAPTCVDVGNKEYVTCRHCDYTTYEEIPATGEHIWNKGEITTNPTCTKEGEMTYTCTVCKTTTKTEPIDKLPHEHAEKWTSNATYHWHECVCGDKKGEEKHTAGAPATATTPQTCTVCGYVLQVETGILFNTLTVDGTKAYGKVSNTTTEFSFINEVAAKGGAKFVISLDIYGIQTVATKTIPLNVGDNTVYVIEMLNGEPTAVYKVTVRRRPMYDVTFNANGGTAVEKQVIEEDYLATEPETTRTGYTFTGWDYDFTQPITGNTKITASWSANTDTKYTVNYYLQNLDDNNYTLHETVELKGETDTTATADIKGYEHFTFNQGYYYNKVSGNINPDGGQVLSVYYTRDTYSIVANNNNAKAGTSTQINGTYKYDKEFMLTATTNAGYTWLGWYDGETCVCESEEFTFKAEKDVTYTATWSANADTKYIVNYYLQNLDDDNYTLCESVEFEGETDTPTAEVNIKEYTHFTYNASKSVISGNINGDGGQVLSVYYTRDSYTISTARNNAKAGTVAGSGTYRFDKENTLTATTNAGYTFLGWYEGETLACETEEFTFKVEKDVTYTATWSAKVYDITYELNGGENHEENVATYTVETATITLQTPTRTGYTFGGWFTEETFENQVMEVSVGSYGGKTFYAKWTPTEYTVTYHHNDSAAKEITNNSYTITNNSSSRWTESSGVLKSTNKGNSSSSIYKITANENIIVKFEYKVSSEKNYDKLTIAKNGTALETVSGSTSYVTSSVTLNAGEYLTFTYSKDVSEKSGDDCAYIKNLTYAPNGKVEQVTTQAYNIETPTFDLITPTRAGYTFNGWFTEEMFENQVTEISVGSCGDRVYYAKWTANTDTKYTVIYYWQNIEDDNYTSHESIELTGTTDTPTAEVEIKEYTHFTYNASKSVISGNINGDGGQVLSVYYTRNTYTLSVDDSNVGAITNSGNQKYGKIITTDATPYLGYEFIGWYSGEELLSADSTYTFTVNKNVTAKFAVKAEMSYFNFSTTATTCSITGVKDKTVTEIVVPDYVTSISQGAFSGCSSLERLTIPFIGDGAGKSHFGIIFGASSYSYNPDYIVHGLEIEITSAKSIGAYAFYGCMFKSLKLPNTCISIGFEAFTYADGVIIWGENPIISAIGTQAFALSSVSMKIPDSVTYIGKEAFSNSNLTEISISDGVTEIGMGAFQKCRNLQYIIIGKSVSVIESSAFWYCDALKIVYYKGTAEEWSNISINANNSSLTNAIRYYYSEFPPELNADGTAYDGNYWRYDTDGITPVIWVYTKPEE